MKQCWPAPERNKGPILDVLNRVLPAEGSALELASGSGQHAVHFARHLPGWRWQPSDMDDGNLASIAAWVEDEGLGNLCPPLRIDVTADDWGAPSFDGIYCANMVHIAPWECAVGLVAGAGRHLADGGTLALYGPYRVGGAHTAPSNEAFDQGLRSRDASWGVRDMEAMIELAGRVGIDFVERVPMPANNQTLIFRKESTVHG